MMMMMDDGRMIGELLERKKGLSKVFEVVSCSDILFFFFSPPNEVGLGYSLYLLFNKVTRFLL